MSDKLYLIRVDMERFIGPMTLKEVRESYRRMEFGLQDEIAASNRAWVAFDDLERIRRLYPDLVGLIKKEMLSGWGTTSPSSIRIRRVSEESSMSRRTVSVFTKVSILLAVSFISFVMFYLVRENKISDLGMLFKDPLLSQAMFHYGDGYNVRFEAFMDRSRDDINEAIKNRNQLESWLPLVRALAYNREGVWPGLPARSLRGKDVEFSPVDCSLAAWRKRWESGLGQWQVMLSGSSFPAADWSRILVWDTDWIRNRRVQEKQWLNPGSYYEACMKMALKALDEVAQSRDRVEADVFRSRLRWKLSLLRGNSLESQFQMSGSLWVLSCIESADHGDEVRNCLTSMKLGREWTRYLEARASLREARNLISENSVLNRDQLDQLRNLVDKIPTIDQFSRFDYTEEKKLYQAVIEKSGQVSSAVQSVNQQSQTFRFDY